MVDYFSWGNIGFRADLEVDVEEEGSSHVGSWVGRVLSCNGEVKGAVLVQVPVIDCQKVVGVIFQILGKLVSVLDCDSDFTLITLLPGGLRHSHQKLLAYPHIKLFDVVGVKRDLFCAV